MLIYLFVRTMCNTVMYRYIYVYIQIYKTQISTCAILVRSYFLVQAISQQNSLYHSTTKIRKKGQRPLPTLQKNNKENQKKKKLYKHGKTQNNILHIPPQIQPFPMKEISCMIRAVIICVFIYEINYFHTILIFFLVPYLLLHTACGLKFSCYVYSRLSKDTKIF